MCIALCCIIALGSIGCNKKTLDVESSDVTIDEQQIDLTDNNVLAKQGVYSVEKMNLTDVLETGEGLNIIGSFQTEEQVYFVSGTNEGQTVKIFSVKRDGSDAKAMRLQQDMVVSSQQEKISHKITYQYYQVDKAGRILALRSDNVTDARNSDDIVSSQETSVCCWNESGELVWEAPLYEIQDQVTVCM